MPEADDIALGTRIRDSRRRAGLSQDELSREIGLERTAVNKIESGTRRVTAVELSDLARVLNVRMSSFFEDPTPALVSHRSSLGLHTSESQIDDVLVSVADDVELVRALVSNTWPDAPSPLPRPDSMADAEAMAAQARALMGLDDSTPVLDLTESASAIGLLAFSRDIGADSADAASMLLREGGIALVNSHMKVGRRRLALAHEVGHYLIADEYTVDQNLDVGAEASVPLESRLDRFARALLLPERALHTLWQEYAAGADDRTAAVRLTSEFRVDMATLARRLRETGAVDSDTAGRIRAMHTVRSDYIELDLYTPLEELGSTSVPRAYARAVIVLTREERISRDRALDLLHGTMPESELPPVRTRRPDEIWNFVA